MIWFTKYGDNCSVCKPSSWVLYYLLCSELSCKIVKWRWIAFYCTPEEDGMVLFAIRLQQNPTHLTKTFCLKRTSSVSLLYGDLKWPITHVLMTFYKSCINRNNFEVEKQMNDFIFLTAWKKGNKILCTIHSHRSDYISM